MKESAYYTFLSIVLLFSSGSSEELNPTNCDDDEDCMEGSGSGSGDGIYDTCSTLLSGSPNISQTKSTEVKVDWSAMVKDLEASCIDELKIVITQGTEREHDVINPNKVTEEIVIVKSCEPAYIKIKVKIQQAVDYIV